MDSRLSKAAREGDVAALAALLEEDPLILDKVWLSPTAETPLHIASLSGKADFAKEMIRQKPGFAKELNGEGLSPLHIAAATGNIEIVRELVKLGRELCLVKDKGGRNALHWAAIRGRVVVIEELMGVCPEAVREVSVRGETALHLAVKNKQFEAVAVLVGKVEESGGGDADEVVNAKDGEGRTILDLAVATKQLRVIELLGKQSKLNKQLDITEVGFSVDQSEEVPQVITQTCSNQTTKSKSDGDADEKTGIWEEVEEMVLVVASLIATVTYQAGLSPPQTIWKQDMKMDSKCVFHHNQSSSSCPDVTYYLFMSFNTAGFFASVFLIFFFKSPSYVQVLLPIALISMMITYVTLSVSMIHNGLALLIIYLITLAIFIYCVLAVEVIKKIFHSIFGFAAGKVSGMAKALVKKRKPSPEQHPSNLDA